MSVGIERGVNTQEGGLPSKERLQHGSRILFVCDVFDGGTNTLPNGIQRTIENVTKELGDRYGVSVLHPYSQKDGKPLFKKIPLPSYPDFQFSIADPRKVVDILRQQKPDAIVTMTTEGPLGIATRIARDWLNQERPLSKQISTTASYSTNIDDYFARYLNQHAKGVVRISPGIFRPLTRKLYEGSHRVLVPTKATKEKLQGMGVENIVLWPRGVDTNLFHPPVENGKNAFDQYEWYRKNPLPVLLNYGRVAIEKGLEDFFVMPTDGAHKVIIGDGPQKKELEQKYSNEYTHFLGSRFGEDLAAHVRSADIMIFPSITDTWGQVVTEAGASGVPTVAYDVTGPGEIILPGVTGILIPQGKSLARGIDEAFKIDRKKCADTVAERYSRKASAEVLLENLKPIEWK